MVVHQRADRAARRNEHVLDSFQGFLPPLGLARGALEWNLPLPQDALDYAAALIPDAQPDAHRQSLLQPSGTQLARRALRGHHRLRGPDATACGWCCAAGARVSNSKPAPQIERRSAVPIVNQIGRDTLPQMLALLARASVLMSPDSGPAHMATMVATPVIGLYAATRAAASRAVSVAAMVRRPLRGRRRGAIAAASAAELPWHRKIEEPGVMDLIEVADVRERLDALLAVLKSAPARIPS